MFLLTLLVRLFATDEVPGVAPKKSSDVSGDSVFRNLLGDAKGALIRAAASTLRIRLTSMKQITLLLALVIVPGSAYAQKSNSRPLGWDLTYASVLNDNHVARNEWLWKWLGKNFKSPITQYVSAWNDETIESSILIEHPAFHAGEHITLWFVRTKNHAYHWGLIEGKPPRSVKQPLDPDSYDRFSAVLASWQQGKPVRPEDTPVGGVPGYMGFLSLYDRGKSRQILLTLEDFWRCETKKCDKATNGRLVQAMEILPHG